MDPTEIRKQLENIFKKSVSVASVRFSPFGISATYKEGGNLARRVVTDADRDLDRFITNHLRNGFPGYGIRSEESDEVTGDRYFVVDPLDSTLSFHRGLPYSAISVALVSKDDQVLVGVVSHILTGITYSAQLGGGAFLNGKKVTLPKRPLEDCLVVCSGTRAFLERRVEKLRECFGFTVTCRSIAYDFATIASGAHDGGVAISTDVPFDTQAAGLIAAEGGAIVTELDGSPWHAQSKTMLVGSPLVHKKLLEIFNLR